MTEKYIFYAFSHAFHIVPCTRILRLFQNGKFDTMSEYGTVQMSLFLDGYWKSLTIDNFLPCIIDDASEQDLQRALQASMNGRRQATAFQPQGKRSSSNQDPFAIADGSREVLNKTAEFLERDVARMDGQMAKKVKLPRLLERPVTSQDLAYSKAKGNQLWVQFLEKAYAKSHGCYQSISGGHIAEAFLDLTGAPTISYIFDEKDFDARSFWYKLLHYRKQQLPMGCGTSSSAVGIIGMHAYSILDVQEVKNIQYSFFQETGVAHGNVSGFTEFDGKVRLLRIRNPHGKGVRDRRQESIFFSSWFLTMFRPVTVTLSHRNGKGISVTSLLFGRNFYAINSTAIALICTVL
jgi:hypothetical protein